MAPAFTTSLPAGDYDIGKAGPGQSGPTVRRTYDCPDGNKALKGTGTRYEGETLGYEATVKLLKAFTDFRT